ncbi:hypothetical protein [Pedobacter sp. MR2016-24]|uniref:hypothetical protein n=1 Tax=Pedobacter sp. MR2016-24 TaxID=2994466 RepID=UPI00224590A4|nr:hypothetical protein [Pedobacter sp. MR2016-24]MCX2486611.1 hypothetical protein [Pedobacter sp. MR2016-24]
MANITYNNKTQTEPYNPAKFNSADANEIKAVVNLKADISQIVDGNQSLGAWNPATNVPALTTTPATVGKFYTVSNAGTSSITGVAVTYKSGDKVLSNGTVWQHVPFVVNLDSYELITAVDSKIAKTYSDATIKTVLTVKWQVGAINATTGALITTAVTTRASSEFIPIGNPSYRLQVDNLRNSNTATAVNFVAFYDIDKVYISTGNITGAGSAVLATTGIISVPSNAAFFRITGNPTGSGAESLTVVTLLSADYYKATNDARVSAVDKRVIDLENNGVQLVYGLNRYDRSSVDSKTTAFISATGVETQGSGNSGVTGYVRIKSGETFVFPNYTTAYGGYSGLYDINKNPIAGTFTQTNTVTWVEGAYFARFSGTVVLGTKTNSLYIYEASKPISSYVPYSATVPVANIPSETILATVNSNLQTLNENKITLENTGNLYDRSSNDNLTTVIINANGGITAASGNSAVTSFIRIKEGQTVVYPTYTASFGGYAALYTKDKVYIQGTAVQANSLTYVPDAYYARFSGNILIVNKTNTLYAYSTDKPLSSWKAFNNVIPTSYLPESVGGNNDIEMWGDSIANGFGNALLSISPIQGVTVANKALGGETSLDTMARMGVTPFMVQPFTIPADTSTVPIVISSAQEFKYLYDSTTGVITGSTGSMQINPVGNMSCEIAGVLGVINFTRTGGADRPLTFNRTVAGTAKVIDRPTMVKPANTPRNKTYCVFLGTNGGWKLEPTTGGATFADADNLVNYYKKIADWIRPTENDFIFGGFYVSSYISHIPESQQLAWWNYFDSRMKAEFGIRFLNIREYLINYGWKDFGATSLSAADVARQKIGLFPSILSEDGTHLLTKVNRLCANQFLERLYVTGILPQISAVIP